MNAQFILDQTPAEEFTAEEQADLNITRCLRLTALKRGVAMTTLMGKANNNLSKCGCIGNKLNTNKASITNFCLHESAHYNPKFNKEVV